MKSLGDRIKAARAKANKGLRHVAKAARISPSYLCVIEADTTIPSEPAIRRIAAAIGCDPEPLIIASGRLPSAVSLAAHAAVARVGIARVVAALEAAGDGGAQT